MQALGAILFFFAVFFPQVQAEKPIWDKEIIQNMESISAQLGVSCTECHDVKNYKKADKKSFQVAKDHIRITQILIDSGMNGQNGQPKANCYMCHQGQLKVLAFPK